MHCSRCFEEITRPHWYKGRPYGATCIHAVSGGKSRRRKVEKWVPTGEPDAIWCCEGKAKQYANNPHPALQPWTIQVGRHLFAFENLYRDDSGNFWVPEKFARQAGIVQSEE